MCFAIPSRVVALGDGLATVECFGEERDVRLAMLFEPVALGDYLLVKAGGFAYEKVDAEQAAEALRLYAQVLAGEPDPGERLGLVAPEAAG